MAIKEAEPRPVIAFGNVKQAVKEYRSRLHTPELVTRTYQAIWHERGKLIGMFFEVSLCPYTQEGIAALEKQGKRVGYLPTELATQQSRHILGKIFPKMESYSVKKDNFVTNDENPSGWFDYETEVGAPYLDTDEKQLIEGLAKGGRKLLNLNQYIVAGQDNKLLTGQYLDEKGTWVRLGSRSEGRVVFARFDRDGYLLVDWGLGSGHYRQNLGGRSSGDLGENCPPSLELRKDRHSRIAVLQTLPDL